MREDFAGPGALQVVCFKKKGGGTGTNEDNEKWKVNRKQTGIEDQGVRPAVILTGEGQEVAEPSSCMCLGTEMPLGRRRPLPLSAPGDAEGEAGTLAGEEDEEGEVEGPERLGWIACPPTHQMREKRRKETRKWSRKREGGREGGRERNMAVCACVRDVDCRWHDTPLSLFVGAPAAGLQLSDPLGNVDCVEHRGWENGGSEKEGETSR